MEEMRRTLVYFKWLASKWGHRATTPSVGGSEVDSVTMAGICAYAYKQAAVYRKMVDVFIDDWHECLRTKSLGSSWLQHYSSPPPDKRHHLVSNVQLYHSAFAQPDTDADIGGLDPGAKDSHVNVISADIDLLEELMDT